MHHHSNPSPSHTIAAWCQGSDDDPGCGKVVPLYGFTDQRVPIGPYESYLIDSRDPDQVLAALEALPRIVHWAHKRSGTIRRVREIADNFEHI